VKATLAAMAPGRVNLIGEHTDYNDGFVFPMALPLVTVIVGGPQEDSGSTVAEVVTSAEGSDEPHSTSFNTSGLSFDPASKPQWVNYVKGVVANFKPCSAPGFKAAIVTSVPLGGGLSSSAALEVATYKFLESLTNQRDEGGAKSVALACQKAEHVYAQVPCGIMDQLVSSSASAGSALLLDCRSLETKNVPAPADEGDQGAVVMIINSNVKHKLTGSEYPTR